MIMKVVEKEEERNRLQSCATSNLLAKCLLTSRGIDAIRESSPAEPILKKLL
jgi:hypothetical protein